jgi:hypothetical protein
LDLPDDERAAEIGALFQGSRVGAIAELLIDVEEDPPLRKLSVGNCERSFQDSPIELLRRF